MSDPAHSIDAVKARLRDDIRAAMTAKNMAEAKLLRTLLAALDNAEAHPVAAGHMPYVVHEFGDKAVEVARKTLTADEIDAVLGRERDEKLSAANDLERHGRTAEAGNLKAEAAIVERYIRKERM